MTNKELLSEGSSQWAFHHYFIRNLFTWLKGKGIWLYDDSNNKYMDCYNNVPCVGHCHPHVIESLSKQAGQLKHTQPLYQ